jgi:hypothetical protein
MNEGIDLEVFCGIVKVFEKRYPNKACGMQLNNLIPILRQLDEMFASLPEMPPKKSRRGKPKAEDAPCPTTN